MNRRNYLYIMLSIAFAVSLASCEKKNEPVVNEGFLGDWYMNREIYDMSVTVMGYSYQQNKDTTFTDSLNCFTLTEDTLLLINGDTVGTYHFDELEGNLVIHSDYFNDMIAGEEGEGTDVSQYIDGLDLSEIILDFNYTSTAGKGSFHKTGSGVVMSVVPYSYDLDVQMYFQREKK